MLVRFSYRAARFVCACIPTSAETAVVSFPVETYLQGKDRFYFSKSCRLTSSLSVVGRRTTRLKLTILVTLSSPPLLFARLLSLLGPRIRTQHRKKHLCVAL